MTRGPGLGLLRRKSVALCVAESLGARGPHLERALGFWSLTAFGVGCTIGAGIFSLTGEVAARQTGPAVSLAFVLASLACFFAGLCYAEFAAMVPISGSAYSYAYVTLGELAAWIVGWSLVLEWLFSASLVAIGWSGLARGAGILFFAYIGFDGVSTLAERVAARAPDSPVAQKRRMRSQAASMRDLIGRETHPHAVGGRRAERRAVHDRDLLRGVERAHELTRPRGRWRSTSISMNMPASGSMGRSSRMPRSPAAKRC